MLKIIITLLIFICGCSTAPKKEPILESKKIVQKNKEYTEYSDMSKNAFLEFSVEILVDSTNILTEGCVKKDKEMLSLLKDFSKEQIDKGVKDSHYEEQSLKFGQLIFKSISKEISKEDLVPKIAELNKEIVRKASLLKKQMILNMNEEECLSSAYLLYFYNIGQEFALSTTDENYFKKGIQKECLKISGNEQIFCVNFSNEVYKGFAPALRDTSEKNYKRMRQKYQDIFNKK